MFGKLDWSKVVTPAASLASNGFVVDHILAQALGWEAPLLNQPEYKVCDKKKLNYCNVFLFHNSRFGKCMRPMV